MICLIEALNYRSLQHVRQPLKPFQVLVGPNASGKSTFLDVLAFLGDLISDGLDAAVEKRTSNFYDLLWQRKGERFELAVEAGFRPVSGSSGGHDTIRYEVAIGIERSTGELRLLDEEVMFLDRKDHPDHRPGGLPRAEPPTVFLSQSTPGLRRLSKLPPKGDVGLTDSACHGGDWECPFDQSQKALASFSRGANEYLRIMLVACLCLVRLERGALRVPNPPGKGTTLRGDGSNLAWVISHLREGNPDGFADWLSHLRTVLPSLTSMRVVERPEDRHSYLMLEYRNGLEVPSWSLSDGTLHLLALTVIPYLPSGSTTWLIEEPENSIHPLNCEAVMQSLQSVYNGQVLVATHSPVVLGLVKPEDVLVFSHDDEKGTQITVGSEHPGLRDWKGEVSLGTLFAGGVLG